MRRRLDRASVGVYAVVVMLGALALEGVAAVMLADASPLGSDGARSVIAVPVEESSWTLREDVTVVVERTPGQPLTSYEDGIVTEWVAAPGEALVDGATALRVEGRDVVVIESAIPPYRDIAPGDSGADVAAMLGFLDRAGYDVDAGSDQMSAAGVEAVRAWNWDHGRSGDAMLLSGLLWVRDASVVLGEPVVDVGQRVSPGAAVATEPDRAVRVSVSPVLPVDEEALILQVGEVEATFDVKEWAVVDPEDVRSIAAHLVEGEGTATGTGATPVPVRVVPPAALVTDANGRMCVFAVPDGVSVSAEPVGFHRNGVAVDLGDGSVESVVGNPAEIPGMQSCGSS